MHIKHRLIGWSMHSRHVIDLDLKRRSEVDGLEQTQTEMRREEQRLAKRLAAWDIVSMIAAGLSQKQSRRHVIRHLACLLPAVCGVDYDPSPARNLVHASKTRLPMRVPHLPAYLGWKRKASADRPNNLTLGGSHCILA